MRIDDHPLTGLWINDSGTPAQVKAVFFESDKSTDYLLVKNNDGTLTIASLSDATYWDFWDNEAQCKAAIEVGEAARRKDAEDEAKREAEEAADQAS